MQNFVLNQCKHSSRWSPQLNMAPLNHKISFCTVCMNRLHHLRQTLPINMIDNENYAELEFILLDYNSNDGLETYIGETFEEYLKSGRLIYYKTLTPEYFNRSHSRNLAFNLATGYILCNIDADNYAGENFATYLNEAFKKEENMFLTTIGMAGTPRDTFGKIAVRVHDFRRVQGYDERMVNYGFEDYDFANRLELSGLKRAALSNDANYFKVVKHEQSESLSNEYISRNLKSILISYLTPFSTCFLFLFNNNQYRRGTLIDNSGFNHKKSLNELKRIQLKYEYSIFEDTWILGKWSGNNDEIALLENGFPQQNLFFCHHERCYISGQSKFYHLTDMNLIQDVVMAFSQINNRVIMHANKLEKLICVNNNDFGTDTVYKNFEYQTPITINYTMTNG